VQSELQAFGVSLPRAFPPPPLPIDVALGLQRLARPVEIAGVAEQYERLLEEPRGGDVVAGETCWRW
jgi:hypothetical protein